ncbi:ATP-binding protein [Acidovorax bellezanensis]|nr:ATP-binding protein [Acidovorax sp. Be4]
MLPEIARGFDERGSRLHSLSQILEAEFPWLVLAVPVNDGGRIEIAGKGRFDDLHVWSDNIGEQTRLDAILRLDMNREIEFVDSQHKSRKLSLGQYAFVRFVLIALANAGPGSVIVVDEPENFLHPNLISRFMRVLNHVLNDARSIAIVATHSPFVVREVQAEQVHILANSGEGVVVTSPRMQTLGANVASISDEVFGDDLHEHLYEELLNSEDFRGASISELVEHYAGELSVEALMLLRSKLEKAG